MKPVAFLLVLLLSSCTQTAPAAWDKTEIMIPMRDGVRLHTLIYAPKNQSGKLPLLIERSPYGWTGSKL